MPSHILIPKIGNKSFSLLTLKNCVLSREFVLSSGFRLFGSNIRFRIGSCFYAHNNVMYQKREQ
jgi:hypothetical protein